VAVRAPGTGRRRWWLAAGAAVLLVLALVGGRLLLGDKLFKDRPRSGNGGAALGTTGSTGAGTVPRACTLAAPGPQAATLPAGTAPSPRPFALPEGWTWHKDTTGYRLAVPSRLAPAGSDAGTCFRDTDGSRILAVTQWKQPDTDLVALLTRRDSRAAADLPGYRKIGITPKDYYDAGAEWEFTYTNGDDTMHARVLAFVTPGQRGYAIAWCTFESDWQNNLSDYSRVVGAFQPAQ
jgi:hypothetical protein